MNGVSQRGRRVRMGVPIRLRGMSHDNKFFDETSKTICVGDGTAITRLQSLVDLDSEIHLTNIKSKLGGNCRVVWINTLARDGWHDVGLELIETEGNIWGKEFAKAKPEAPPAIAQAYLQCQRCRQSQLTPVPEAEDEFVSDGFTITRPCERCKATTVWAFTPVAVETPETRGRDQRRSGRAPIKMKIKVIRTSYGSQLEDVCETVNVSRGGACFLTARNYAIGEELQIVMPYDEGDVAIPIPIPARVVRNLGDMGGYYHAVAVRLEPQSKSTI